MTTPTTTPTLRGLLLRCGAIAAEYPPDLLAARRAAFVAQVQRMEPDACDVDTEPVSEEATKPLSERSN